jgi:hypothetical protein
MATSNETNPWIDSPIHQFNSTQLTNKWFTPIDSTFRFASLPYRSTQLIHIPSDEEEPNPSQENIGDEGAKKIANELAINTTLTQLDRRQGTRTRVGHQQGVGSSV